MHRPHRGLASIRSRAPQYLRYWFLSYLLSNTRMLLMPVYATVYFPPLLRWLGAKIGRGTEISTVMHVTPDLLSVGDGSFLADACLVGGYRVHHGHVELGGNRIGEKTFVGNSAVLPGGSDIGDDALLGVLSAPASGQTLPDNERWLGAPAFALPQHAEGPELQRHADLSAEPRNSPAQPRHQRCRARPAARRDRHRLAGRVHHAAWCLPPAGWPLWVVVATVPLLATVLAFATDLVVAVRQAAADGHLRADRPAAVVPLRVEQRDRQRHLRGRPPNRPCRRCWARRSPPCACAGWAARSASGCSSRPPYFSEFDLVEIGDHAALNLGATIQTHLFEDRVMKADYLRIGAGCTVGNLAGRPVRHAHAARAPASGRCRCS